MRKYDSYKDSGIDWIDGIPKHWELKRLKDILSFGTGLSITKQNLKDVGVPCVNYGEIHSKFGVRLDTRIHKLKCVDEKYLEESPKAILRKGDFVFADTSEDVEGAGNFTHLRSEEDVFAGYHTVTVKPKQNLNSTFLAFEFDSLDFRTQIRQSIKGIKVFSVTQSILKNTKVWMPPIEEQTQIANYLDKKTTQIDNLITKKEQLIQLLEEERIAIINQAVTKGLNPEAPMKDSGIEWLGEIPEHWEVIRLKFLLKEPLKYGANEPATEDNPNNPRYIRITDFGKNGKLRSDTFKSLPMNKAEGYLLKQGDVLFARSGATVGKTFLFDNYVGDACFAGYLIKANCDSEKLNYRFLYFFTKSSHYESWKESTSQQATIENIGADKYNQLKLALPSIMEQEQLVSHMLKEETRIENLLEKVSEEIKLLKEYKTALISEVVTGKVDVRDEKLK